MEEAESDLDSKFFKIILEVEKRYSGTGTQLKHEKIRIEQWTRKLCAVTTNKEWKRNRNLYALWLLDQVINKRIERPFTKVPPDGPQLDTLNPAEMRAKLSKKVQNMFREKSQTRSRSPKRPPNVKIFDSDCVSSENAENA